MTGVNTEVIGRGVMIVAIAVDRIDAIGAVYAGRPAPVRAKAAVRLQQVARRIGGSRAAEVTSAARAAKPRGHPMAAGIAVRVRRMPGGAHRSIAVRMKVPFTP